LNENLCLNVLYPDWLWHVHGEPSVQDDTGKTAPPQAAMGKPETKVSELCAELGIARQTLYRFVSPGESLEVMVNGC
jgi:hypothetical protein